MAYTEKVSLSGTALSFLLYECVNSTYSQEGFLIGDVTSEITNHISDSQSDNARLDTQIMIRTVLPLPSVSLFYLPTGRIKEDYLSELFSNSANEVVGWYKYRKNSNIKPTFRDKLISRGLQKYFEKNHGVKHFVTCNLASKTSSTSSTHTFSYRFGKINCFDMYEFVEDVTANLGEKFTGYKKPYRLSPHSIFNKIIHESNVQSNDTEDAILYIQKAVDMRLAKEAKIAALNECTIRELEAEILHMKTILAEKQSVDLETAYNNIIESKSVNREIEMAKACVEAMNTLTEVDILKIPNVVMHSNHILSDSESSVQLLGENDVNNRSPSPILMPSTSRNIPVLNYAAALKNKSSGDSKPTTKSKPFEEDLITFDVDENHMSYNSNKNKEDVNCIGDSSPEY